MKEVAESYLGTSSIQRPSSIQKPFLKVVRLLAPSQVSKIILSFLCFHSLVPMEHGKIVALPTIQGH